MGRLDIHLSIVAVAGLWLNVAGTPFAPSAGPYAVVLTWALFIFGFIFVRTIELFLHRPPPSDAVPAEAEEMR
jgi:hypothetical protein